MNYLWNVRPKPPARAHDPPTETFIIYDESSSPNADDYLIDANYPMETYIAQMALEEAETGRFTDHIIGTLEGLAQMFKRYWRTYGTTFYERIMYWLTDQGV